MQHTLVKRFIPWLAVTCGLFVLQGFAAELKIGDLAPDFDLKGSDGAHHRLVDYRGKTVVLAWFPKAFTGG